MHRCCMCTARWSSRFSPTAGRPRTTRTPDPLQHVRRADARELQHVRGAHGAAAEHDLTREHALLAAGPLAEGDADRAGALHDHPADLDPAAHLEVGARADRREVGARRREPPSIVDHALGRGDPLLDVVVDAGGDPVAGLAGRGEERVEERAPRLGGLQDLRARVAADAFRIGGEHVLVTLEVGQQVGVVPARFAGLRGPLVEVGGVAAVVHHPVDAAGAAQDLAARLAHAAVLHVRLGLGRVAPVVAPVADREAERGGHVDDRVPAVVGDARFQHEDLRGGVRAEPVGERRARRPPADDDVVVVR